MSACAHVSILHSGDIVTSASLPTVATASDALDFCRHCFTLVLFLIFVFFLFKNLHYSFFSAFLITAVMFSSDCCILSLLSKCFFLSLSLIRCLVILLFSPMFPASHYLVSPLQLQVVLISCFRFLNLSSFSSFLFHSSPSLTQLSSRGTQRVAE